ncbi:GGDEF domain-containing protein [Cellulomonas sp. DKR-3]|uniref:GGDEF domain-containing protein n=1 Tax=Cellulomonas fulva TaxID=2835530 RepID=A0ABS5TXQ1_9CELL|nr:GGDEF domain-containing protein [Cellulomonas fulva]MBT0993867.1 GGDEF domain-containing protein [Cellulomonas fulva]
MSNDVDMLVRAARAAGGVHRLVADLAVDLAVVEPQTPMSEVELLFRSPHVSCLGVQGDDERIGLLTRTRFADAQTGRLGFGRAVLSRRPVVEVADFAPLVVDAGTGVVEAAALAMERQGAARYDDVVVRSATWASVATADLVLSLVASLSARSLHDPLTRLPGRELVRHTLGTWWPMTREPGRRLLLVVVDVDGFGALNATHGAAAGDDFLVRLAGRLSGALPTGTLVGRTGSDEFMAVTLVTGATPDRLAAHVARLDQDLARALAPQRGDDRPVRLVVEASHPATDGPDALVADALRRMHVLKRGAASVA